MGKKSRKKRPTAGKSSRQSASPGSPPSKSTPSSTSRRPLVIALGVLLLAAAGGWWWWSHRAAPSTPAEGKTAAAPHARRPVDLTVPELAARAGTGRQVIFVGLDGADWQLMNQYIEVGSMPHLKALRDGGVWGELTSETPMLSPLVWTTMMTGTSPLEHRILDFLRVSPATGRPEPIPSSERARPAIWNMASMAGRSVAVFGLWATWPAEPVHGVLVTDRLVSFLFGTDTQPHGLAYPESEQDRAIAILRNVEKQVGYETLHRYLPWLSEARYEQARQQANPYADPVGALRRILIQTDTYAMLALQRLGGPTPPDLTILYLEGTDSIGHAFAQYLPPLMAGVRAEDSDHYKDVPQEYFAHVDGLLGRVAEIAKQQNAVLVLASDHGFRWQNRPRLASSSADRTAALWHRQEGIYLIYGEGIQPKHETEPVGGVRQICATLLDLMGLPMGGQVTGPPLPGAPPANGQPADYLAHYRRPPEPESSPSSDAGAQRELAKLQALGYLGGTESGAPSTESRSDTLSSGALNNIANLLQQEGRTDEALAVYKRALKATQGAKKAYLWSNYSNMLHQSGREEEARAAFRKTAEVAEEMLRQDPGDTQLLFVRANALNQAGDYSQAADVYQQLIEARPERALFRVEQARSHTAAGRWGEAKRNLEKAYRKFPHSGDVAYALAQTLLTTPDPALRDPQRALELAGIVFRAAPDAEHGVTVARALDQAGQGGKARGLLQQMLAEAKEKQKTEDIPVIQQAISQLSSGGRRSSK
jgi:tetratricopeptide (TPR) repeat protein